MALVDRDGRLLGAQRPGERFAFCSTFKLLLAGMVLDGQGRRDWSLEERLPVTKADLTVHSPVTERHVERGWMTLGDAAEATVTVSDNGAANLLLKRVGGTDAFNGWLAAHGDRVSRLDRLEPLLNENAAGDPRDTTTPRQIARNASKLIFGNWLPEPERERLRHWLIASETGLARIRAGLPSGWVGGDKTGTCGGNNPSYNDVAFLIPERGSDEGYILAIYLDRPTVEPESANRALADVARAVSASLP